MEQNELNKKVDFIGRIVFLSIFICFLCFGLIHFFNMVWLGWIVLFLLFVDYMCFCELLIVLIKLFVK